MHRNPSENDVPLLSRAQVPLLRATCVIVVLTGNIDLSPEPPNTPLATEVLDNLAKYPHCVLLTRVGQFYEVNLIRHFGLHKVYLLRTFW